MLRKPFALLRLVLVLGCCLALAGCHQSKPVAKESLATATAATQAPVPSEAYFYRDHDFRLHRTDTTLLLNGEPHVLTITGRLDSTQEISHTFTYQQNGQTLAETERGFNATYTFALHNSTGRQVFASTFTKKDFAEIDEESVTQTGLYMPQLVAFAPAFKALVFTINFHVPETCLGVEALVLLNLKGELVEKSLNNWYGGSGCDGEVEVPANGAFVLGCRKLLYPDGRQLNLWLPDRYQIATRLLNDSTFLLIHDYSDSLNTPNASIRNSRNNVLAEFRFKGYYDMLGHVITLHYEAAAGRYYLLDDVLRNVQVLTKKNPAAITTIGFGTMPTYDGKKRSHEIAITLNSEVIEHVFYHDTLTNAMRHRLIKDNEPD